MSLANELTLLKAKVAEKKHRLEIIEVKADNHRITIREALDPLCEHLTELDLPRIVAAVDDLNTLYKEAVDLEASIKKISKEIGD